MSHPTITLALLAGGLAKRMRPLTKSLPKALLEVAGEPFITHQLRLLQREGIRDIVICSGYLGEKIQAFIGNSEFCVNVSFSLDGDTLLGTGGALVKALPLLSDPFWIMYGDSYLDIDFQPVIEKFWRSGNTGLMTVLRNDNLWGRSNVLFERNRVLKYDKINPNSEMKHIDYGLGIFYKRAFDPWRSSGKFDLAEVYELLVKQEQLAGHEITKRFYEIGSKQGFEETHNYLTGLKRSGSQK